MKNIRMIYFFLRARTGFRFSNRVALEAYQQKRLEDFRRRWFPLSPFYRSQSTVPFSRLPIMNKAAWMEHFNALNTRGISRDKATAAAVHAEANHESPNLFGDIAVGLSSGTSGQRSVFMTSASERQQWAGILFGKMLGSGIVRKRIFGRKPVEIAFFFRAENPLYDSLGSRTVHFVVYGLWKDFPTLVQQLQTQQPDLLVAPSRALHLLAVEQKAGRLNIRPTQVISVADVLEPREASFIESAFGRPVQQIYQCTEGLLATTCPDGSLHLNEEHVFFEKEWLDAEHTRFVPIITDFTRTTQLVVRYRMNDILRVAPHPCRCGRVSETIAAIEGRCDDVLYFRNANRSGRRPVFPDLVRRRFALAPSGTEDYIVRQITPDQLEVALCASGSTDTLQKQTLKSLQALSDETQTQLPRVRFVNYVSSPLTEKRRRVERLFPVTEEAL